MAFTKLLIIATVLVAGAQAKFVWQDDDDNLSSFKPSRIQMPVPPTPPRLPFAPFQPFQPFQMFQPFAPFKPFPPSFINVQPPRILTPDEIRNAQPGPNQVYNGVMVSSTSNLERDKDGNYVKKGGTHVLTNVDGKVNEFKQGNAPPDLNHPIRVPQPW